MEAAGGDDILRAVPKVLSFSGGQTLSETKIEDTFNVDLFINIPPGLDYLAPEMRKNHPTFIYCTPVLQLTLKSKQPRETFSLTFGCASCLTR